VFFQPILGFGEDAVLTTTCSGGDFCYYALQVINFGVVAAYLVVIGAQVDIGSVIQDDWSSLVAGLVIVGFAVAQSVARAMFCQFSFVALLHNPWFLYTLTRSAGMGIGLVGQVDPGIDLAVVTQVFAGVCCTVVFEGYWLPFWASVMGIGLALADYVVLRIRLVQGSCSLQEPWKPCPLLTEAPSLEELRAGRSPASGDFAMAAPASAHNDARMADAVVEPTDDACVGVVVSGTGVSPRSTAPSCSSLRRQGVGPSAEALGSLTPAEPQQLGSAASLAAVGGSTTVPKAMRGKRIHSASACRVVAVVRDQPSAGKSSSVFALSYRWAKENSDGFADPQLDSLLGIAAHDDMTHGFVDKHCTWPDGSMATLDVNRSVYTAAGKHYIYADKEVFDHFILRMRTKFFLLVLVQLGWFAVTAYFRKPTVTQVVMISFLVAVWLNHLRNYVTWGIQKALPGLHRVWLRLEYECRRGDPRPSVLFDGKVGTYQDVQFGSSLAAGILGLWWLATMQGTPICVLPSACDFSGLQSRYWHETAKLIDEWTGYTSPFPLLRCQHSSQLLACSPGHDNGEAVAPLAAHVIGGEVVYWFFGRLVKFDGYRGKVVACAGKPCGRGASSIRVS